MAEDSDDLVVVRPEDTKAFEEDIIPPEPLAVRESLQRWLHAGDPPAENSVYHRQLLRSWVPGTCQWLFEHNLFKQWQSAPSASILWVKGVGGTGKSVLSAATAQKLSEQRGTDAPVLSFFFHKLSTAPSRPPQSLLRDCLSQLLPFSPWLQARIKYLKNSGRDCGAVSLLELWEDLLDGVASLKKPVYLVIDGLDEMDSSYIPLFEMLARLDGGFPRIQLKVLVTSRPAENLESVLRGPHLQCLHFDEDSTLQDVSAFIDYHLGHAENAGNEDGLKGRIRKEMILKAKGLFLRAKFLVDKISPVLRQASQSELRIQALIKSLPTKLEDIYEQILVDHSKKLSEGPQYQRFTLELIVFACKPLYLNEITTALRSEFGPDDFLVASEDMLYSICGPLVIVQENQTVQISHRSVFEFLLDETRLNSMQPVTLVLHNNSAHRRIGLHCVSYLQNVISSEKESRNMIQPGRPKKKKYEFFEYARSYWHFHLRLCNEYGSEVFPLLDQFIEDGGTNFIVWKNDTEPDDSKSRSLLRLHVAALFGLSVYAEYLLQTAAHELDINARDATQKMPLHWACIGDHEELVQLLIARQAKLNEQDSGGWKPIHYAAMNDSSSAVRHLLEAGVDPLTPKTKIGESLEAVNETAVQYACERGHIATVTEFIRHLEPSGTSSALCWAARAGNKAVVESILDFGNVSPDSAILGDTALFLTAAAHDFKTTDLLISRGADVNKFSRGSHLRSSTSGAVPNFTPLHGCVLGPTVESTQLPRIIELLVKNGCNPETRDSLGRTPLLCANSGVPSRNVTQALLKAGAQASAADARGRTLLHSRSTSWIRDIRPLTLEYEAKVNKQDDLGETPLHCAMKRREEDTVKALLENGADPNIPNLHGNTALFYGRENLRALLLHAGADPNHQNKQGETCAHLMENISDTTVMLNMLLEAGLNLELKDLEGRTILLSQVQKSDNRLVLELLNNGADINAQDGKGQTCVHLAFNSSDPERCNVSSVQLLNILMEHKADLHCVDYEGNTPLHKLANGLRGFPEEMKYLRSLLEFGADIHAKNNLGRTFIHNLSCRPAIEIQRFFVPTEDSLIEVLKRTGHDIDFNVSDKTGWTPMHLASATGSEAQISQLFRANARLDIFSGNGRSPLHVACRARQPNALILLLKLCEDAKFDMVNRADDSGRTPLFDACRSGRPESVRALLEKGANVNTRDRSGRTPLHACAGFEDEQLLWNALYTSTDVNDVPLPNEWMPTDVVHMARHRILWGDDTQIRIENSTARVGEIVQLLVKYGADSTAKDSLSMTPMDLAVSLRCQEMVRLLADDAYDPPRRVHVKPQANNRNRIVPPTTFAKTLLSLKSCNLGQILNQTIALTDNDLELIHRQRDPGLFQQAFEITDEQGKITLLSWLSRWGCTHILAAPNGSGDGILKLDWFQDPTTERKAILGRLLLHACKREVCNLEMIKLLVEEGANINTCMNLEEADTREKWTALHLLAVGNHYWHLDAIDYLLQGGANIEACDDRGRTPLFVACQKLTNDLPDQFFNDQVTKLLLQKGANVNHLDRRGKTCLQEAASNSELLQLLLSHGADPTIGNESLMASTIFRLDFDMLRVLLDSGVDCNNPSHYRESKGINIDSTLSEKTPFYPLLNVAMTKGNTDLAIPLLNLLLDHGADWTVSLPNGETILQRILRENGICEPFITLENVDWHARDKNGMTPLLSACQAPQPRGEWINRKYKLKPHILLLLLDRGIDFTDVDRAGRGALHHVAHCVRGCAAPLVTKLLSSTKPKINVALKDKAGYTALHLLLKHFSRPFRFYELSRNSFSALDLLLEQGADITEPDPEGITALHHFATSLHRKSEAHAERIAKFEHCLALGMDINARDNRGCTPLFWLLKDIEPIPGDSARQHDVEMINAHMASLEKLFATADITRCGPHGETALHVAMRLDISGSHRDVYHSQLIATLLRIEGKNCGEVEAAEV